ncbi:hypothetical protein HAX54_046356 [Datura stramonium]|uniref:Receptor ligand binding region domain-containing protein n=1 Tax=Datura stramonium TaxID=4076 RepID=A0ABS8WJ78_DATST|nr:hypothetical protein [Datura stramonium]
MSTTATTTTAFSLLVYFLLIPFSLAYNKINNGSIHNDCDMMWRIGAIIDPTTRVGREQKVAMEMAVDDFNGQNSKCSTELVFNFVYSHESLRPAVSLGSLRCYGAVDVGFTRAQSLARRRNTAPDTTALSCPTSLRLQVIRGASALSSSPICALYTPFL